MSQNEWAWIHCVEELGLDSVFIVDGEDGANCVCNLGSMGPNVFQN